MITVLFSSVGESLKYCNLTCPFLYILHIFSISIIFSTPPAGMGPVSGGRGGRRPFCSRVEVGGSCQPGRGVGVGRRRGRGHSGWSGHHKRAKAVPSAGHEAGRVCGQDSEARQVNLVWCWTPISACVALIGRCEGNSEVDFSRASSKFCTMSSGWL